MYRILSVGAGIAERMSSAETRVKTKEVLFAAATAVLRVEEVCACLECSKASQSVCGDARRTHLICLPLLCPLRDILSLFRCSEQLLGPHQQKQQVRCGDFGWKYHLVSPLQHPLLFARRDTPTIGSRLTFQGDFRHSRARRSQQLCDDEYVGADVGAELSTMAADVAPNIIAFS